MKISQSVKSHPVERPPSGAKREALRGYWNEWLFPAFRPRWPILLICLLLALAFHFFLLASVPPEWGESRETPRPVRSFKLTMVAEEPVLPEDFVFVHTNPDIPSHDPGETLTISTKDQVAAQELTPDESLPEGRAQVEGPLPDSSSVFTGSPDAWPFATSPVIPEDDEVFSDPSAFAETTLPPLQVPDAEDNLPSEEGTGLSWREGEGDAPSPVDGLVISADPRPEPTSPQELTEEDFPEDAAEGTETQRRRPAPRPRTQIPHGPPLVLGQEETRVDRIGRAAVEARESAFGHYLDRMTEAIVNQWHRSARELGMAVESGTMVAVEFTLYADGEVGEVIIRESTTQGVWGMLIIQDAIRSRAPYGIWTEDMKAIHGTEREVKMRFFYR